MAPMSKLDGPRQPPASGRPPERLIILVHGYGADGNDLIGLAPYLARALPTAGFVAPNAPERCAMQSAGYQWWGISTFSAEERLVGIRDAAPILDAFIDDELARHGLCEQDVALVGFSQGTMMSLHVGLRRAAPVAAIVGFSGALVAPDLLKQEIQVRPPVLLVHGDQDELLPVGSLFEATQGLADAEVAAEWHVSQGIGHSIAQDGLDLAVSFLTRAFSGQP